MKKMSSGEQQVYKMAHNFVIYYEKELEPEDSTVELSEIYYACLEYGIGIERKYDMKPDLDKDIDKELEALDPEERVMYTQAYNYLVYLKNCDIINKEKLPDTGKLGKTASVCTEYCAFIEKKYGFDPNNNRYIAKLETWMNNK